MSASEASGPPSLDYSRAAQPASVSKGKFLMSRNAVRQIPPFAESRFRRAHLAELRANGARSAQAAGSVVRVTQIVPQPQNLSKCPPANDFHRKMRKIEFGGAKRTEPNADKGFKISIFGNRPRLVAPQIPHLFANCTSKPARPVHRAAGKIPHRYVCHFLRFPEIHSKAAPHFSQFMCYRAAGKSAEDRTHARTGRCCPAAWCRDSREIRPH